MKVGSYLLPRITSQTCGCLIRFYYSYFGQSRQQTDECCSKKITAICILSVLHLSVSESGALMLCVTVCRYESVIATLCENLDSLDEPEARAAMIWIVGEYAERIDNADELLESFLEGFHDESTQVYLGGCGEVVI